MDLRKLNGNGMVGPPPLGARVQNLAGGWRGAQVHAAHAGPTTTWGVQYLAVVQTCACRRGAESCSGQKIREAVKGKLESASNLFPKKEKTIMSENDC